MLHRLSVLGFLFCIVISHGERFELTPAADTALIEWEPTNNVGKGLRLRTGGESPGRSRALVKFDLAGIPSTSRVVYARANFRIFYPPTDEGRSLSGLKLMRHLRAWQEGTGLGTLGSPTGDGATWLFPERPAEPWLEPGGKYQFEWYYLSSAYAGITATHQGELASFRTPDLLADVQKWIDRPLTNHGWMVYNPGEASIACCRTGEDGKPQNFIPFSAVEVASREDEENAPLLVIGTGNPEAPIAIIDGEYTDAPVIHVDAPAVLNLETLFQDGRIFYTLDGSRPSVGATRFSWPLTLNGGEVIRSIAYNADFSAGGAEAPQIRVVALPEFPLAYNISGQGRVDIYDSGVKVLTQDTSGTFQVASNHVVSITGTPTPGFRFVRWSGDVTSTEPTLTFPMKGPVSLTAHFEKLLPPGPALSVRHVEKEWLVLQFPAESTGVYHFQNSTDLATWSTFQIYSNRTGVVDTILPLRTETSQTFYRLRVNPGATTPY